MLPANFILVAAMNPCPCGYYGDKEKQCRCTAAEIAKYKKKISGPLLDRIDLQVNVQRVPSSSLHEFTNDLTLATSSSTQSESDIARGTILAAQSYAKARLAAHNMEHRHNGLLSSQVIAKTISLAEDAKRFLDSLQNHHLSPRGYFRLLKTARTIADLEQSEKVSESHLAEAFGYRFKD